jgi:plastocyanin
MGVTIMLVIATIMSIAPSTTIKVLATSLDTNLTATTNYHAGLGEGRENHVTIVGIKHAKSFSPNPIDIKVGDTVTWANNHRQGHTVTSDTAKFDSGNIAPGQTFNHTFDKPGNFEYYCIIHPSMIGEVNVS